MQNKLTANLKIVKQSLMLLIFMNVVIFCHSQSSDRSARRLLLRDEGMSQLSYADLADPKNNWFIPVPPGRDMQLAGNGRVLIGTGNGYEEHEIVSGKKVFELTTFPGTLSAHRLRNGNTLLTGIDWQGKQGIVLAEVDSSGKIKQLIVYPGFTYVRLVRQTKGGNFLIAADDTVFEGNAKGGIVWQAKITGKDKPHAWQALRLANGQTVVSAGYAGNFQIFAADGKLINSFNGPDSVHSVFYAGFQVLPNGNFVVTNWQGHGPNFGASGIQVLEYTPSGNLVWSWKQDAAKYSSLQGVIVLDGLDLNKLHAEDGNGMLAPAVNNHSK